MTIGTPNSRDALDSAVGIYLQSFCNSIRSLPLCPVELKVENNHESAKEKNNLEQWDCSHQEI